MSLQTELATKSEELALKRRRLADLFKEANETTDETKRDEIRGSIKSANTELIELNDKVADLQTDVAAEQANRDALKAMRQPVGRQIESESEHVERGQESEDDILSEGIKSVRELLAGVMEHSGRKSAGNGLYGYRGKLGDLAIKTLITSADMTPLEDRQTRIVGYPTEERTVADLMLQGTTTGQKVTYFEETTFTNAAAETDEGAAKPESALDFTLREDAVRKIATWVPVTDEMLADVPAFESYLRARLASMVRYREELQLLQGAGTGVTIQGLYNRTGVQTVTGYGQSTIDSILQGITEVQTDAFAEPTALVIHPRDWFDVRTSKDTTGNYLLGPATQDPNAARPWGLQVRVTANAVLNTALVGAFNLAQVYRRSGIDIAISTENEDYFLKNKVAVRAEERLALAVYRPSAFCKIEAIVVGS